ncbi:hypothetical protein GH733_005445 [Mirounga leonina]|nr:hypothetical protein GH733_005445 [Mirounga leonina]
MAAVTQTGAREEGLMTRRDQLGGTGCHGRWIVVTKIQDLAVISAKAVLQADSPEDMHSWIKEIGAAVQALKCHPRDMSFSRSISLTRSGSSGLSGGPNSVLCRGRPPMEEKRALCKAPSVASSWQPWTPVPQARDKLLPAEETPGDSLFMSRLGESSTSGVLPSSRIRHRSEPQHPKEKPFLFSLDDESIRTSDV